MKKRNIFLFIIALALIAMPVYADSMESVRVIKFWADSDDLVVEKADGQQMLIQHNYTCSTMSTEFPVHLIWEGDKVGRLKVAPNEICDVKNYGPYTSNIRIVRRVPSVNSLVTSNTAELEWRKGLYEVDYGSGCTYLRNYEGQTAYVYTPKEAALDGATLYLPKARGECTITSARFLGEVENQVNPINSPIKNLQVKAENNQAVFAWNAYPEGEKWIANIAYSKYPFDPTEYAVEQLPGLKRTPQTTIRFLQLDNDQKYYFYVSATDVDGNMSDWQEIEVSPVQTAVRFVNNPDLETFEVTMEETDDAYILRWPDKSAQSKRYMIQLFVDGPRKVFSIIPAEQNEYILEKKPEWAYSRFRFTVRSIPIKPTGIRYYDGIFWREA